MAARLRSTAAASATNAPSSETTVDVWRSVSTIFNVAITGADNIGKTGDQQGVVFQPNPHGGYQLDGRVDTLENQALGAFQGHAQIQVLPPPGALSDIATFEKTQFSSSGVATLANAMLSNTTPFPDPDPALNALEQQGKNTFNRVCATCHGGSGWPSTTSPAIGQRYHRLRSQCPRPPVRDNATDGFGHLVLPGCTSENLANARTYEFTAGTTKTRQTADDLGRAYFTGRAIDVGAFDVKDARGAVRTPPYFHNNSVGSIEELVEFYRVFFIAVARDFGPGTFPVAVSTDGIHFDRNIPQAEVDGLVAYLKKL